MYHGTSPPLHFWPSVDDRVAIRGRPSGHPWTTVWPSVDDRAAIPWTTVWPSVVWPSVDDRVRSRHPPQSRPVPHGGQAQCSNNHRSGRPEQCGFQGSQRFFPTICCLDRPLHDLYLWNLHNLHHVGHRPATVEPQQFFCIDWQVGTHLRKLWNLHGSLYRNPWAPVVAQQRAGQFVQDLHLRNLNGFQHS